MDMPTGTAVAAPGGNRRTVRGRGPPRRADALTSRPRAGGARYGVVVVHGSRAAHHRQKAAANLLRGGGYGSLSSSKPPPEWLPGREATAPLTTRPCVTRRSALRRSTVQDETVEPPGSHEPTAHAKTPKKAAASGWMGSALEYYDFFIYAQAAALIFPTIMFAKSDPKTALIQSFVTYGVGYVARPIGAFVLGHWGDTHGRKNVLVLCMLLMGGSTFAIALLPTYASVGLLAPILLVILRLIQGFAVGGEI